MARGRTGARVKQVQRKWRSLPGYSLKPSLLFVIDCFLALQFHNFGAFTGLDFGLCLLLALKLPQSNGFLV